MLFYLIITQGYHDKWFDMLLIFIIFVFHVLLMFLTGIQLKCVKLMKPKIYIIIMVKSTIMDWTPLLPITIFWWVAIQYVQREMFCCTQQCLDWKQKRVCMTISLLFLDEKDFLLAEKHHDDMLINNRK